jgi:hypothetical protein
MNTHINFLSLSLSLSHLQSVSNVLACSLASVGLSEEVRCFLHQKKVVAWSAQISFMRSLEVPEPFSMQLIPCTVSCDSHVMVM